MHLFAGSSHAYLCHTSMQGLSQTSSYILHHTYVRTLLNEALDEHAGRA